MDIAKPEWTSDWLWSIPLIALTLVVHASGLVIIAVACLRRGYDRIIRATDVSPIGRAVAAALLVLAVGFALAVLHGLEATVWAFAYLGIGAADSFGNAMLYSLDAITTRGASGLRLAEHWRLMGALEATCGMLVFGASTAFLFSIFQIVWRALRISFRLPDPADDLR